MIRTYYVCLDHPIRGKGYYTLEETGLHEARQFAQCRFSEKVTMFKVYPYRDEIPEDYCNQLGSLGSNSSEAQYAR